MSRTDKTAPYNVKALYYPTWVVEVHDHTNGACELPERATYDNVGEYDALWFYQGEWVKDYPLDRKNWKTNPHLPQSRTCYWGLSREFQCNGMARCGCRMCSRDPFYEVPQRKRRRMEDRRFTRGDWMKEY